MDIKLGFKRILLLSFVGASFFAVSCDDDVLNNLASGDTVAALKEALTIGAKTAATNLGQKDGYYGDAMVKIGMPQEVATVAELMSTTAGKTFLNTIGAEGLQTDNLVELMNRAAEKAAPESAEIFASAITSMTVSDGESILFGNYQSASANEEGNITASFGSDKAATSYLYDKTYSGLQVTFGDVVTATFDQVSVSGLTLNSAWSSFTKGYNKIAEKKSTVAGTAALAAMKLALPSDKAYLYDKVNAIQPVNTNLGEYVTGKALDGLFTKVADKEVDIRTNAAARTSDLLKRVFGRLDE